MYFQVTDKL